MSRFISFRCFAASSVAALTLLVAVGASIAQTPTDYSNTPPGPFYQPVSPLPVELGFTQDHASTAAEGFLRGKAGVIQAEGNFLLSESQSRILRQQARWLVRENDLKQTQALFTQKKMWSDARFQAVHDRQIRSAEGQQILAARQATVYRDAYQLSHTELDRATGWINWPAALETEEFACQRERVEDLVREQFAYGDPQPATSREIVRCLEQWSRDLSNNVASLPREEYLAAQKFLTGLKYSTTAPTQKATSAPQFVSRAVAGGKLANQ